jgi:hypothetical protein
MHYQKKDILKKLLQRIARCNVSRYPTIQKIHISDGYVLEYKRREGFPSPSDPNRTEYALFRLMSYDDELALFEDADDIAAIAEAVERSLGDDDGARRLAAVDGL